MHESSDMHVRVQHSWMCVQLKCRSLHLNSSGVCRARDWHFPAWLWHSVGARVLMTERLLSGCLALTA
jgi:hypothetical protein